MYISQKQYDRLTQALSELDALKESTEAELASLSTRQVQLLSFFGYYDKVNRDIKALTGLKDKIEACYKYLKEFLDKCKVI